MDAREIEDGELVGPRGIRAFFTNWMAQLHHEAYGTKEHSTEVLTVPLLREMEISNHGLL